MKDIITQANRLLLASAQIGHLATANTSGVPRIVPVCFIEYVGNIYSVIDKKPKVSDYTKLKRVQNILNNSEVSFLIDHYTEDWNQIWYLQINGSASIIHTKDSVMHHKLIDKYPLYANMEIKNQPLIQIIPRKLNFWSNTN